MRRLAVVICLFSAAVAVQASDSLRAQLDTEMNTVAKFLNAKDIAGFKKFLATKVTPDFKHVENGTSLNFDQMCAGMGMGLSQMSKVTIAEAKILSLVQNKTTATATSRHTMAGILLDAHKKPHQISVSGLTQDSYVKQGGAWKLSKMVWIKQTTTMDGKSVGRPTPSTKAP